MAKRAILVSHKVRQRKRQDPFFSSGCILLWKNRYLCILNLLFNGTGEFVLTSDFVQFGRANGVLAKRCF
jgi:hypothetical protein